MEKNNSCIGLKLFHENVNRANTFSQLSEFDGIQVEKKIKLGKSLGCIYLAETLERRSKEKKNKEKANVKICGICRFEKSECFCQDCKVYLCSSCLVTHNKFKLFQAHNITCINDVPNEAKKFEELNGLECQKMFGQKSVFKHDEHIFPIEERCCTENIKKSQTEIENLETFEILERKKLENCEENYVVTNKEILELKKEVENNYEELMKALMMKEGLDYERIDTELIRVNNEYLEHRKKIENDILSIQEAKYKLENGIEKINSSLKDDSHAKIDFEFCPKDFNFEHQLSFKTISTEVLLNLQSCITKLPTAMTDKYWTEEKRMIEIDEKRSFKIGEKQNIFQLDGKFIYSLGEFSIFIYLTETLKLSKTINFSNKFSLFSTNQILHTKNHFYFTDSQNANMQIFNEEGEKVDDIKLPSTAYHLAKSEEDKVLITCKKNQVWSYYPLTKSLVNVNIPSCAGLIYACSSLGREDYLACVQVEEHFEIITIVKGESRHYLQFQNSNYITTNGWNLVFVVEFKKNLHILNKNLQQMMMIELNLQGNFRLLHMDKQNFINLMSFDYELNTYFVKKYKFEHKKIQVLKNE